MSLPGATMHDNLNRPQAKARIHTYDMYHLPFKRAVFA